MYRINACTFALSNWETPAPDGPVLKHGFILPFLWSVATLLRMSSLPQTSIRHKDVQGALGQLLRLSAGLIGPVGLWLLPFLPSLRRFVSLLAAVAAIVANILIGMTVL